MTPYGQLIESLKTGAPLAASAADELLEKYPYFSIAASRALLNADLDPERQRRYRSIVALNAPDSTSLMAMTDPDGALFARFYPPERQDDTSSTESAIDTFLDTYGHGVDPREEALLERLIFNPVADYSEVLAREAADEPAPAAGPVSEQDALLDAFLSSQTALPEKEITPEPVAEQHHTEHYAKPDPEAPLSESLAKLFIKRKRYDKAYEIIKQLSLNFPEKSVYFADQLRFLRKLMLNQQYDKPKK